VKQVILRQEFKNLDHCPVCGHALSSLAQQEMYQVKHKELCGRTKEKGVNSCKR
jgi:transcription elongation factor Elf1